MRNTEKHPNNEYNISIYLSKEDHARLDALSQVSGMTKGRVLAMLVRQTLPKAKMVDRTYVVKELSFD